ncbi:MAG: hypothetical protein AB1644_06620 [Candidatus Zixiibacteriota bacterium]
MFPEAGVNGLVTHRSIQDPDSPQYIDAISEEDYVAVYTDTFTQGVPGLEPDYFGSRRHKPLAVRITQRSYAWSYSYAEDFILFDYTISNIGNRPLDGLWIGVYNDPAVGYTVSIDPYSIDDLCGYVKSLPYESGCDFIDTMSIAWGADNDGDPIDGQFSMIGGLQGKSDPSVSGVRILSRSFAGQTTSFNWWVVDANGYLDFGPRGKPGPNDPPFRDFRTGGLGNPKGDVNKFYVMSNGEIDYAQLFTKTIGPFDRDWLFPAPAVAESVSVGSDPRYLISTGPYDIPPGASTNFAFAVVAGENFHTDPNNLSRLKSGDVHGYYEHLDFSDLAKNAMWAKWIYDNPGVDTDGDGYFGKQRICVFDSAYIDGQWIPTAAETTFYEGDGVADWRGAAPPPAPTVWLYPGYNSIRVRFNGKLSETTKDIFSGIIDFEGYRIYWGLDERVTSLSLLASYDRKNYDKWVYNERKQPEPGFELQDIPFTLEQLRCAYGSGTDPCNDTLFDPLDYGDLANLYYHPQFPDSVFYFTIHDYNASEFGVTTEIRKIYPNEPEPSNYDTLRPEQLTDDGYVKYYEYEFTIRDLLSSVPYYVNVTAFDFGSPKGNLKALETSKTLGIKHCYPAGTQAIADSTDKQAYVYPNPYRIDAGYRLKGYEGRMREDRPNDRVRLIHFANIPPRCTIEIHSLDGDLVRRIDHDMSPSDPNSSHETWDLITRNTQLVVSGIYYWTIEDDRGNVQMGKLVIIM